MVMLVLFTLFMALGQYQLPIREYSDGVDSGVYQYIGIMMKKGYVPYTELWDNKGPLMYFIQYLGALMGKRFGLFLIMLVFIFATCFIFYKTARLFTSGLPALFAALSCGLVWASTTGGGNYTEDYALLFIAIAIYFISKSLTSKKDLSWIESVVIGAVSACTVMLRINLVAPILGFCAAVFISALCQKKIASAIKMLSFFIVGAGAAVLPALVYLISNNALSACIECAYKNNFSDAVSIKVRIIALLQLITVFDKSLAPALLTATILLTAVLLVRKKTFGGKPVLLCGVSLSFLINLYANSVTGKSYDHYGTSFVCITLIPFVLLFEYALRAVSKLIENNPDFQIFKGTKRTVTFLLTVIFVGINTGSFISASLDIYFRTLVSNALVPEMSELIKSHTSPDDKIQFLGGVNSTILVAADREAASKYFYTPTLNSFSAQFKDKVIAEVENDIFKNPPKMIFISNGYADQFTVDNNGLGFPDFLDGNYFQLESINEQFLGYVRKN